MKLELTLLVVAVFAAGCGGGTTYRDDDTWKTFDALDGRTSHKHTRYCSHAAELDRSHDRGRVSADEYIKRNRKLLGSRSRDREWRRLDKDLRRGEISREEYVRTAKKIHGRECRN